MKHKVAIIILSISLTIFVLYGVMTTLVIRETKSEISDLKIKYNEVVDDYKVLSENYQNEILDKAYSSPVVLEAIARSIDDKAKISVIDGSIVYMYVPYSSDVKSNVEKFAWSIPLTLENNNYTSCIITAVDDAGKCVYGWTILQNSDSYAFLSE